MNLTSVGSASRGWLRGKLSFVSLVCGLAVAVAAAVVAGALDGQAPSPNAGDKQHAAMVSPRRYASLEREAVMVFIVDTQAEADELEAATMRHVSEAGSLASPASNVSYEYVVGSSVQSNPAIGTYIGSLIWSSQQSGRGPHYSVVDLRSAR